MGLNILTVDPAEISGGAGATTTLNNLGTTAINADLLPSATNTRKLGANANVFHTSFARRVRSGTNNQMNIGSGGDAGDTAAANMLIISNFTGVPVDVDSGTLTMGSNDVTGTAASGQVWVVPGFTVNGNPGLLKLGASDSSGSGNGGSVDVTGGNAGGAGTGGSVNITAGTSVSGAPGQVNFIGILAVQEAADTSVGTATLVGGTVTVANTRVTADTKVFYSVKTAGGTQGHLSTTQIAATSFTINSTSVLDTSTVHWLLIEPA